MVFLAETEAKSPNLHSLLIFDGHGSDIIFQFVSQCCSNNVLLLGLPSHSSHLLQALDDGLGGRYQHFWGIAVDNYIYTSQNNADIKQSVLISFLTEARQGTFHTPQYPAVLYATGLYSLNPSRVLGKLNPKSVKWRDTLRTLKLPTASHEILHKVLATSQLLAKISLKDTHTTVDKITAIMRELGHQLEEEIACKELWRELSNKLQTRDRLYNKMDRRKPS